MDKGFFSSNRALIARENKKQKTPFLITQLQMNTDWSICQIYSLALWTKKMICKWFELFILQSKTGALEGPEVDGFVKDMMELVQVSSWGWKGYSHHALGLTLWQITLFISGTEWGWRLMLESNIWRHFLSQNHWNSGRRSTSLSQFKI